MKLKLCISSPAGLLSLISTLIVHTLYAQVPEYNVVFTEESSTVLIETVSGLTHPTTTITWTLVGGGDAWTIPIPPGTPSRLLPVGTPLSYINFAEPTAPLVLGRNFIDGRGAAPVAGSDDDHTDLGPGLSPLNQFILTDAFGNPLQIIGDGGAIVNAAYEFIDNGDQPLPDASATLPLCGFACLSLVVMRRYLTPHTVAA
jgi:hypothetical protein